jgi:putative hydrolase of the HAD superfamily
LSKIRAITFDVGSTLIDSRPSVGHIYADLAAKHGYPDISPSLLTQRFRQAFSACTTPLHSPAEWSVIVDQTFLGLVDPPPSKTFFPALYQRFREPSSWIVHTDVIATLVHLQTRNLQLAILSNWDNRLRPLLAALHLAPFFQHIIVSSEFGVAKPNASIFHHAAKLLNLHPASILHVGDSPTTDFAGARNAGFQALLLDRNQPHSPPTRIRSLSELLIA